jgi:hypothetical protein
LPKASGIGPDGNPVSEAGTGVDLLAGEDGPRQVLADSAYGSGDFRACLAEAGHLDLVKPSPGSPAATGGCAIEG